MDTKKIMKNASYLFVGNITVRFVLAFATIAFAKDVSESEYGMFTLALAVSAVVCYFTDAGLTHSFMREGTKEGANISVLISSYLKVRLLLALVISILFVLFSFFIPWTEYERTLILLVVLPTMFGASFQGVGLVYFQVTERMQFTALISVLQGITASVAILAGMYFGWSLMFIAAMYGISSLVTGIIAIGMVLRHTHIHKGWDNQLLHQLLTFTVNGVLIMTLPQLGPIILAIVADKAAIGAFALAYKIPTVLYQIPGVIAAAFYPRLFSLGSANNHEEHRLLSSLELKLMSFIGIGISLPFIVNPSFWIVSFLGEDRYVEASAALGILAFMVAFQSINYPLADYLTTKGEQWKRTTIMAIGFVAAIIGYFLLGNSDTFGVIGAAFAAIIAEIVLLVGFTSFIQKGYLLLFKGTVFNVLAAVISYALYATLLTGLYPLVGLTLMGVIYGVLVLVLDRALRDMVLGFVKKKKEPKLAA